jgi:predicted ATPase
MKFIEKAQIIIPELTQDFEFGDLTIFIGRSNCGKTCILNSLFNLAQELKSQARGIKHNSGQSIRFLEQKKITLNSKIDIDSINPKLIALRNKKITNITAYREGYEKIEESVKNIDPTITELGNDGIRQNGQHKKLDIQGSGAQNLFQILSESLTPNFLLIDEPEISQFPSGKIEMLKHIIKQLDGKQIIISTHDPTIINQYLIKKFLGDKKHKIIIYSFCNNQFNKINFEPKLDPEIHCGYLNQTLSGKPTHLIFEGQTEYYAFQALLYKYCLERKVSSFAKKINNLSLSYLEGGTWQINIHHVPPPNLYKVLVIIDGEYKDKHNPESLPTNCKIIESVSEIEEGKINLMFLHAENIEKAFEGIYEEAELVNKPLILSEKIWTDDRQLIKLLMENSDNSKQIYDIVHWGITNAI